jgi:hypothetical protein
MYGLMELTGILTDNVKFKTVLLQPKRINSTV